jgi:hypothetical protein
MKQKQLQVPCSPVPPVFKFYLYFTASVMPRLFHTFIFYQKEKVCQMPFAQFQELATALAMRVVVKLSP